MNVNKKMAEPITVKRSQARDGDILCCRGNGVLSHPGNVFYLSLIKKYQKMYQSRDQLLTAKEKRVIVRHIVDVIESLDPPGRFLKLVGRKPNEAEDVFHVIQDRDTRMKKVSQALRERPKKSALFKEAKEDSQKQLKGLQHFNGGVQNNSSSNLQRDESYNALFANANQPFNTTSSMRNSSFLPEPSTVTSTNTFSTSAASSTSNDHQYPQYKQNQIQHQQQNQLLRQHQPFNFHHAEKIARCPSNPETATKESIKSEQNDINNQIQKARPTLQNQHKGINNNNILNISSTLLPQNTSEEAFWTNESKEKNIYEDEDCSYYHFSELKRGKIVQEKWFIHLKDNKICPIEPGAIVNPDHLVINNLKHPPLEAFRLAQSTTEPNRNQVMNEILARIKTENVSQEDHKMQGSDDFKQAAHSYDGNSCTKRDNIDVQQDAAHQKEEGIGLGVALLLNLGTPNISHQKQDGVNFKAPKTEGFLTLSSDGK